VFPGTLFGLANGCLLAHCSVLTIAAVADCRVQTAVENTVSHAARARNTVPYLYHLLFGGTVPCLQTLRYYYYNAGDPVTYRSKAVSLSAELQPTLIHKYCRILLR